MVWSCPGQVWQHPRANESAWRKKGEIAAVPQRALETDPGQGCSAASFRGDRPGEPQQRRTAAGEIVGAQPESGRKARVVAGAQQPSAS